MSHVAWNVYMDAFTFISRQFLVSREMNKCGFYKLFEAMQIVPSTRATLQVTSASLETFREKILPGPENSKNVAKIAKIKGYNTRFRTFQGPSSECHGMPPRDMGGHWKSVMWLRTYIWMHLSLFRDNFRFHEK